MFSILGARPAVGRLFTEAEDHAGGPDVMVLSHAFWMRQFGGETLNDVMSQLEGLESAKSLWQQRMHADEVGEQAHPCDSAVHP